MCVVERSVGLVVWLLAPGDIRWQLAPGHSVLYMSAPVIAMATSCPPLYAEICGGIGRLLFS